MLQTPLIETEALEKPQHLAVLVFLQLESDFLEEEVEGELGDVFDGCALVHYQLYTT